MDQNEIVDSDTSLQMQIYKDTIQRPTQEIFKIITRAICILFIPVNTVLNVIEEKVDTTCNCVIEHDNKRNSDEKISQYVIQSFGGAQNIYKYQNHSNGLEVYVKNLNIVDVINLKYLPCKVYLSDKKKSVFLMYQNYTSNKIMYFDELI